MGKGILLELHGRNAVVLTSQGEFRRVQVTTGAWEVGDEIDIPATRGVASATSWGRWGAAAAAAVVLSLSPVGYRSWALAQPVSVVTVDINPSLRLTLNKNEQVLKAEGLNADGVTLLQGVDWKRRPLGDVVADLTARAVDAGKLNLADEAGAVVVAVASAKPEELPSSQADTIATDARKAIQASVQKQGKARAIAPVTNVAVLQGTAKEKAAAEAEGLTLGQHFLLQEIHQSQAGADVPPADMKKFGASKLLKDLQIKPGPIFNQAEQHHGGKGGKDDKQGTEDTRPAQPASGEPARPIVNPVDAIGVRPPGADDNGKPGDKVKPGDKAKPDDKAKPGDTAKPKDDNNGNQQGDGRNKNQQGDGKKDGNQAGQNHVIPPKLPADLLKPPVIKDPLKRNGQQQDDTGTKASGSQSGEKDGASDDHGSGRRSGAPQKAGDSGKGDEKGNDQGKGGKRP